MTAVGSRLFLRFSDVGFRVPGFRFRGMRVEVSRLKL